MTISASRCVRQIIPPALLPRALFLRRRWSLGNLQPSVVMKAADLSPHPVTRSTPAFRQFSSSRTMPNATQTPSFRWLNLENAGLSMVERLTLEEALLKNTRDNWIIVGRHKVWPPKYITIPRKNKSDGDSENVPTAITARNKQHKTNFLHKALPDYIEGQREPNPNGMIVMGIGGKAEKLLNSRNITDDQLLVVKRFSGGGTVVMDENAIWTTLIAGRRNDTNNESSSEGQEQSVLCKPYPRDIMKWTAKAVFGPAFDVLNANHKKRTTNPLPRFSLKEDDYVLTLCGDSGETRKIGGNAQAITGKQGWLHHTSFLWDYEDSNMERYLKLPEKRPDYRVDRSHKDFLVKLKDHYGSEEGPSVFLEAMKEACMESLGIEETNWPSVYKEVFGESDAAMNAWWLENRTRIQYEL